MSKKSTTILIVLMALSLVGLVSIQAQWIYNAYQREKGSFTEKLNNALENFAAKVNNPGLTHVMGASGKEFFFIQGQDGQQLTIHQKDSSIEEIANSIQWIGHNPQILIDSLLDTLGLGKDKRIAVQVDVDIEDHSVAKKVILKRRSHRGENIISHNEIIIQESGNKPKFLQFEGSDGPFLFSVMDKPIPTLVMDLGMHLQRKEDFNSLMRQTFEEMGIFLEFESAILNDSEFSEVDHYGQVFPESNGQIFLSPIRNFSNFNSPDYLLLQFPGLNFSLWKELFPTLSLTLVFITLILLCFAYAMVAFNRQKKISTLKSDFINNMTHELKTPISSISLATEALNDPSLNINEERSRRFVGMIKDENNRLKEQVEKVLEFARAESQTFALNLDHCQLNHILEREVERIQDRLRQKEGHLSLELDTNLPSLPLDEFHMRGVIFNLIDNAVKYGGNPPEIRIRSWHDGKNICYSISDNGDGISRSDQKKIFEKFYRVNTGNVHDVKGLGIGLSYSQAVIQHHQGSLELDSVLGQGSTFTIKLPMPMVIRNPQNLLG